MCLNIMDFADKARPIVFLIIYVLMCKNSFNAVNHVNYSAYTLIYVMAIENK